ncbi:MAG: hypothetical protein QY318_03120 [Candidatus Dojkabacteria bacterium]|nr:MAG: hypothetical protein QY318_03120 [Candidatus Dojkabacteria bacterium]
MNEILELVGITTVYELLLTLLLIVTPLVFMAAYGWFLIRDARLLLIVAVSIVPLLVVPVLSVYIIDRAFDLTAEDSLRLGFLFASFVNLLNLSVLVSKYAKEVGDKKFDIDHVSRDHFASSLNTAAVTFIMVMAVTIFLPSPLKVTMVVSLLTILATLAVNHLMVRALLRERPL